ncbi:MAG: hypothetical protein CBC47_03240 [Alphaproteobacteria bacterium TMED87]|nr:hypothetical protein [Rhodospirillaceae bacterium]OUV10546.1 MAG: hypothetical protein CBC47_03240 [Alphaproteobacteria bacterium TMED87]|tara:strand:+ start:320 stop:595 length:276 start_codon:yes stop_codon:yes gene_type:complete
MSDKKKYNRKKNSETLDKKKVYQDMNKCKTAEDLNENFITPFTKALVDVCGSRGYVINIYGDSCNLVISPDNHSENIYKIINSYLDELDIN